jgi:hypothetical protein
MGIKATPTKPLPRKRSGLLALSWIDKTQPTSPSKISWTRRTGEGGTLFEDVLCISEGKEVGLKEGFGILPWPHLQGTTIKQRRAR